MLAILEILLAFVVIFAPFALAVSWLAQDIGPKERRPISLMLPPHHNRIEL